MSSRDDIFPPEFVLCNALSSNLNVRTFNPSTNVADFAICKEISKKVYKQIHTSVISGIQRNLQSLFPKKTFDVRAVVGDSTCSDVWWSGGDCGPLFFATLYGTVVVGVKGEEVESIDPRTVVLKKIVDDVVAQTNEDVDKKGQISSKHLDIKVWIYEKEDTTHNYASDKIIETYMNRSIESAKSREQLTPYDMVIVCRDYNIARLPSGGYL